MEKFNYNNVMEVPQLEKITINIGLGGHGYYEHFAADTTQTCHSHRRCKGHYGNKRNRKENGGENNTRAEG